MRYSKPPKLKCTGKQAILTRYRGPTNVRGSRILVSCPGGRMRVNYDHAMNSNDNHKAAAYAMALKMGWVGSMVGGTLPGGFMAWVFTA